MKKTIFILIFLLGLLPALQVNAATAQNAASLKPGDIVFQKLVGGQSKVVELVSGSPYTHCAIVMEHKGRLAVYESIGLVGWKDLDDWVKRGVDGHYVVMRLKGDRALTPEALRAMMDCGDNFKYKIYDLWFQWSDQNIYCSELVWKIYMQGAGIKLTNLRPFKDYDNIQHARVQKLIKARFGNSINWDEPAVTPADLMESPLLEVVFYN